jgi:uncharacterized membrane protein
MGTAMDTEVVGSTGSGGPIGTALGVEARPQPATAATYQRLADEDRGTGGESLADFLGYFSIGLGLAELLAPQIMTRIIGIKHPDDTNRTTMRLMGLREISHGVAILSTQQPAKAVWSRVAGDALDLALLGRTMANPENDRGRTLFATLNVLAVTALDVMAAKQLSRQPETVANAKMDEGIIRTKRSITIRKPVEEVYAFWRAFENLPRFMYHLESVEVRGEGRSHWTAKAPLGRTVEWDAEMTADTPGEEIAWRSDEDAGVRNAGRVRFRDAPGGRGTEVIVELTYDAPGGKVGGLVAKLFGEEPTQQVKDDLRRFKQVLETGEVVRSEGTPEGQHASRLVRQRPARPVEQEPPVTT